MRARLKSPDRACCRQCWHGGRWGCSAPARRYHWAL